MIQHRTPSPIVHNTIATAPIPIPTLRPVDSPLGPFSVGLRGGDATVSLAEVVDSTGDVVEERDEEVDEEADGEVDEVVNEEDVVDVAEVAVLVSVLGREEARIQK